MERTKKIRNIHNYIRNYYNSCMQKITTTTTTQQRNIYEKRVREWNWLLVIEINK